ncbi:MAG: hypothetical protein PF517_14655 [Salinivirgaceae bacterium]|jgi:hypothetical protein|nr:hypothetical protein [Salinivirgaceae bacterium]
MKRPLYYLLLSLLLISFSACDKDKNKSCADCDAALLHMAEKLHIYGCNPSYMEKAWDAINQECDRGSEKVWYMAETCILGATRIPPCGEVLSNTDVQDDVLFTISYSSTVNDTIRVKFHGPTLELVDVKLDANQTISIPYPHLIEEGDEMIINFGAYPSYKQETIKFSFNRPDKYYLNRTMNITRDPQSTAVNKLNIDFVNW